MKLIVGKGQRKPVVDIRTSSHIGRNSRIANDIAEHPV
jgi:hypothetical protein